MASKQTDPETAVVAELPPSPVPAYDPNVDTWESLKSEAAEVLGTDLASGELLDALVGVPFVIYRVTFRAGIPQKTATGGIKDSSYVSAEAVIAPEHVLKRRRVNVENLPFEPGSQVVFNDGSSGVYRQTVAALAAQGYITLPSGPTEGASGETIFDLPVEEWADVKFGKLTTDRDGHAVYSADIRLSAPRGLRISTYESPFGEAATRYLG